jgi:hypothetical protein
VTLSIGVRGGFGRVRSVSIALLLAVAAALAGLPGVAPALAASCTGAHVVTLDRGSVTPASGTAETSFRFGVRFRDTANCRPNAINVRIPGLGTGSFPMIQGTGKTFRQGVAYSLTMTLPPGRWTFWFAVSSGTGRGERTTTLKMPRPITVTAPATPGPVTPTPPPATGSARPTKPSPTASRAPGSSGDPVVPGPGDDGGGGLGFLIPAIFAAPMGGVVGPWLVLTGVGMTLFWLILRRRPEARLRLRGLSPLAIAGLAGAGAGGGPQPRIDEDAGVPRWLRPSLLAARTAGWGVPPPRAANRFHEPAAPGVDRREIGYRLVRVADGPDDLQSEEIGRFDKGDQVEILETKSPFLRVRGADGLEGWVHQAAVVSILDNLD